MNVEFIQAIVALLTGGFLAFLAITIIRDNLASRLNRVTAAMLFFASLGPLFMALGIIIRQSPTASIGFVNSTVYHLSYIWEFFFPFLLLFSWIFPDDRLQHFKHTRLRYLIFIPTALHLMLLLFFHQLIGVLGSLQISPETEGFSSIILLPLSRLFFYTTLALSFIRTYQFTIFGLLNILYLLVAFYFIESGRKLATHARLHTQTRVVYHGLRLGIVVYVVVLLAAMFKPDLIHEATASFLYLVAGVILVITFTYATLRYQFLDVRLRFRQSFVYSITSALLVGTYIVLVVQSRHFLEPLFGAQTEILSYVFIIIILLVFQPVNKAIDNLIQSLFIRTRTDHRNIIERFSKQVISLFDPVKLRRIIEETLKTYLMVDKVYFILYDDTIEEYSLMQSEDFPRRIALKRDDLLLRGINLLESPTYLHTLADYMTDSELASIFNELRVKLILPLKDAEHLLGCLALTDKVAGYRYSADDINLLGVLSNQMVTALTNARLYVDSLERIRLQEEVSMARQIQLNLLPAHPPTFEHIRIAVHSTPSRTVGGDFYDFIEIDEKRLGIVIADASGKGMPAALMIAQIQAIIHSEVNNGNRIDKIISNMNELIAKSTTPEKYVTLFYGELDITCGELAYCNAGHNYPILVHSDGQVELLKTGGPLVGALPRMEYRSTSIRLRANDILFLFTDGLSEAMNNQEQEYGEERIRTMLIEHRTKDPETVLETILNDVRTHDPTYPPRDDTTIISLKIQNGLIQDEYIQ